LEWWTRLGTPIEDHNWIQTKMAMASWVHDSLFNVLQFPNMVTN
jgi:hypothetical protein